MSKAIKKAPTGIKGYQGVPTCIKGSKGRFRSKNDEQIAVLRMEFSLVENLSGLQESIFSQFRSPSSMFIEKTQKMISFIKFTAFPLFPHIGQWLFGPNRGFSLLRYGLPFPLEFMRCTNTLFLDKSLLLRK